MEQFWNVVITVLVMVKNAKKNVLKIYHVVIVAPVFAVNAQRTEFTKTVTSSIRLNYFVAMNVVTDVGHFKDAQNNAVYVVLIYFVRHSVISNVKNAMVHVRGSAHTFNVQSYVGKYVIDNGAMNFVTKLSTVDIRVQGCAVIPVLNRAGVVTVYLLLLKGQTTDKG